MNKPINLLWTGGSDSTFELLHLLLIKKRSVQPYYILDRRRKSLDLEIKTMDKIKQLIFLKDPSTEKLLLPTIFKELNEIKYNERISNQYKRLAQIEHLGKQYEWLPQFAEQEGLHDLELSITSGEYSDSYFRRFLKPHLFKFEDKGFNNYRLKENPVNPDLTLFKYFRFPIIEWSKLEMQQIAKKYNFQDIMKHTWFCHAPIHQKPCGICNPCKIAIKEGMGKRIPFTGLLRNVFHTKVKPLLTGISPISEKEYNMKTKPLWKA